MNSYLSNFKARSISLPVLLLLAMTLPLATCATTDTSAEVSSQAICQVWFPISWAYKKKADGSSDYEHSDTIQTIFEVKKNNAARAVVCDTSPVAVPAPEVPRLRTG